MRVWHFNYHSPSSSALSLSYHRQDLFFSSSFALVVCVREEGIEGEEKEKHWRSLAFLD